MQWLIPSIVSTLSGTIILTLCYFYLYAQDKQKYLKIWTISWGIYLTRYLFLLAMLLWQKNDWLLIGNQLSTLISGTLLLYGTYLFIDEKFPKPFWYLFVFGTIWIFISVLNQFSFMVMSLPTFSFLAAIYIWTGYVFYKYSKSKQKEASIVGITFMAWGIHKANYPFMRPVVWFAPWGYLIAAMLEFLTALGLIIVYFRKTKDESQVAEKRYKELFNSIRDAILVVDTKRSIVECNPAFTELFGYSADEIKGKNTQYLFENDVQFKELGAFLKKQHDKRYILKTVNYKKKNNQIFPGETGVCYLKNIQSEVIGFIELIRDISDRRKAEKMLKKRNYYLERAQNLGQIGTWELDLIRNILVWTDENCRIFGVPEGSVVDYETFLSKVHPGDRDYVDREWKASLEGKPYDIEHRLLLDDEVKWVREKADITFDDNGEAVYAIGFTQEITDRKQSEKALKESERKYRTILQTAIDGFWLTDLKGNLIEVNASYSQMSGYSIDDLLTMNIYQLESDENPEEVQKHLEFGMKEGFDRFETVHKKKDNSLYDVDINFHYLSEEKLFVVFIKDISKQKEMQKKMIQAQKMESIGLLAGGIAHDFNNILYPIIGFTQLSQDELSKEHPVQENLQDILDGANRASNLVKRILRFSRQKEPELKPTILQPVIQEIRKLLRSTIPSNIDFQITLYEGQDAVLCDESEIHEILLNLCTNSYHAIAGNNGVINISLRKQNPSSKLDLPTGEYLCLSVKDNGVGIPEKIKDKIFEPYLTTKDIGKGSGLGLSTQLSGLKITA